MHIKYASVLVDDQAKALEFYTNILGFVKKADIPVGEFRWLSVTNADGNNAIELLLEPNVNEAAKIFQSAIKAQGIPATAFVVEDIKSEFDQLTEKGVKFTMGPTEIGPVQIAIFDDNCGNLIQLVQE